MVNTARDRLGSWLEALLPFCSPSASRAASRWVPSRCAYLPVTTTLWWPRMAETSAKILADNGVTIDDLALVVPHQANLRIIQAMQQRLGVPDEKIVVSIDRYGNTTAATLPLGLRDAVADGRLKKGDLVLLVTVGAGYTTGSVLLRWAY